MLHPNTVFDMTPIKGALFTSVGGCLGFINGLLTTSQMTDTFLLGASGAAGALAFSIVIALLKKTKPWWKKLGNKIVKIW